MSIKKRILLSNLIMVFFLTGFMIMFLFFMISIYTQGIFQPEAEDVYSNETGSYNLSELQVVVEDVSASVIRTGCDISKASNYNSIRRFLNVTKTTLVIIENDEIAYYSDGITKDTADSIINSFDFVNAEENSTFIYADKGTMVCRASVETDKDSYATLYFVNNTAKFQNDTSGISVFPDIARTSAVDSIRYIAIICIAALVVINLVIVFVITRSILKPLQLLKQGTRMISEGNLDFEIDYHGDDEISDVIDNFEDMRRKLLVSNEKQKKYEESRKELLAGIGHDLSTPLTSIKGYVSGLLDGVADSPEKQEKYLKTIYNTAEEMDRLVSDVFLFSKLDVDKIPFDFEKIDIGSFIESCAEEMSFTFEKEKLLITYSNRLETPEKVFIDRSQFARVLLNIAKNSAKYKKEEVASLHIDLSLVPQEDDEENTPAPRMIRIVFKDNGIGVPEELTGKIFETFYRSDPARSNTSSGSGLGLAIAKQIVNRHCGSISAESMVGEGLSIIINLPVADEEEAVLYEKDSDN